MTRKMIALDVDGTLLHSDGSLSRKNLTAIKNGDAGGLYLVINSGRTFYELPEQVRGCGCFSYFIYSNGAGIADRSGQILSATYIDREVSEKILQLLFTCDVMVEIYRHGRPYTDRKNLNEQVWTDFGVESTYRPVLRETRRGVADLRAFYLEEPESVEMIHVFFRDPTERLACFDRIGKLPGVKITTSMKNNMEIFSAHADKGEALSRLALLLGVRREEIIAVGDSRNDIPMIRFAGDGVAVGNACDELRQTADRIVCTNDEDAAASVIMQALAENHLSQP